MTKQAKLISLLIFLIILFIACFLFWKNKAQVPHTILIQNYKDETVEEPETPQDNMEITTAETEKLPELTTENAEPKIEPRSGKIITNSEPIKESPTANTDSKIIPKLVSWGFSSSSNRKIDTIIIHSSYNALGGDEYDVEKLIAEYKEYGVAPHYLIDRQGKVYQLVADKNIAYHAGVSRVPDGRTGVNNFSLGIEMMNTKKDAYSSAQYSSLNSLLSTLKSRYSIKYTLGHDDIAPGRKTDPWNFNWKKIK